MAQLVPRYAPTGYSGAAVLRIPWSRFPGGAAGPSMRPDGLIGISGAAVLRMPWSRFPGGAAGPSIRPDGLLGIFGSGGAPHALEQVSGWRSWSLDTPRRATRDIRGATPDTPKVSGSYGEVAPFKRDECNGEQRCGDADQDRRVHEVQAVGQRVCPDVVVERKRLLYGLETFH